MGDSAIPQGLEPVLVNDLTALPVRVHSSPSKEELTLLPSNATPSIKFVGIAEIDTPLRNSKDFAGRRLRPSFGVKGTLDVGNARKPFSVLLGEPIDSS